MPTPIVSLTRRETISTAHRLHSAELSEEDNKLIYGKCNNPNGHGHNYGIVITIRGPVDKKTGMVMNLTELRDAMHTAILEPLDHKNLDKDLDYFKYKPSTTENLAVFIWDNLKIQLPDPHLLYEVKIEETEKNSVIFRGETICEQYDSRAQGGDISSDSD